MEHILSLDNNIDHYTWNELPCEQKRASEIGAKAVLIAILEPIVKKYALTTLAISGQSDTAYNLLEELNDLLL